MRRIAWTHYAAPQTFYGLAGVCWKPLALLALALVVAVALKVVGALLIGRASCRERVLRLV